MDKEASIWPSDKHESSHNNEGRTVSVPYLQHPNTSTEDLLAHKSLETTSPLPRREQGGIQPPALIDTSHHGPPSITANRSSPLSAELRLQTSFGRDQISETKIPELGAYAETADKGAQDSYSRSMALNDSMPARTSSVKSLAASHRSLSPASVMSSPGMGPLAEITPLPSPLGSSSGSWVNMPAALSGPISPASQISPTHFHISSSPPRLRKPYPGLGPSTIAEQVGSSTDTSSSRIRTYSNRSSSEYVPITQIPRARNIAVSTSHPYQHTSDSSSPMQREEHVAPQRGISAIHVSDRPPTPPKSQKSATDSSESEGPSENAKPKFPVRMQFETRTVRSDRIQRWVSVRQLGVGTFSTVVLATSDLSVPGRTEDQMDPKTLVAVKICEHGPAGGADEKKIESSLKRELEILKSIHHPSLVHLRAVSVIEKRAFLVLDYSAGGDLFELASLNLKVLVPTLIKRIFAELVAAVLYLHGKYIVHRDIKLENVLLNPRVAALSKFDYATYPFPIVTLTDLGLGRAIPRPPESPLLDTRCGSEDYAAPELLMGQGYDGRQTDAWALGVLLYALMEGRLPFDPIPGARRQSPTSHRIARCEWQWVRWGDTDGDWDVSASFRQNEKAEQTYGIDLEPARSIVEGLLKRVSRRWPLTKVNDSVWVRDAIRVEGGIRREAWAED